VRRPAEKEKIIGKKKKKRGKPFTLKKKVDRKGT